jgi:hypothetical protein
MPEPFNWERDRAMCCKALLDAREITDEQAELLKEKLALAVAEVCPGQEGAIKASIAEEGSRRWEPVGEKIEIAGADPLFTVADIVKAGQR